MSFYIRKSVKVGPFRYNLSKSGIGISAGIPGLRVGSGPRGNYVHMGKGGIYFRKSLDSSGKLPNRLSHSGQSEVEVPAPASTVGATEEIESASVADMVDSSSKDLLAEINQKIAKSRLFPMAIILSIVSLIIAFFSNAVTWLFIVLATIGFFLSLSAYYWDEVKCSVVLFYAFDKKEEKAYNALHKGFASILDCERMWHISTSADVLDKKYHAGASHVISRQHVKPYLIAPKLLKINVEPPVLEAGKQKLVFLPDKLLVLEQRAAGAISYSDLSVEIRSTRFIESESVPSDAQIVGRTWKYVNKSGGPDRRFSNNPEIPIVQYEEIHLSSPTGLNELFQISKTGIAHEFSKAVRHQ